MPDTISITLVKRFVYRLNDEEFSNTYHLTGANPTNEGQWNTIRDAIWALEAPIMKNDVKFVRAYGYNAGSNHADYTWDSDALGVAAPLATGQWGAAATSAGDQAAMCRALVGVSSTGKKVYIRKYFHRVFIDGTNTDKVGGDSKTAMLALATALTDTGIATGRKWCAPQGAVGTAPFAHPFITTRTLKRRGKRP